MLHWFITTPWGILATICPLTLLPPWHYWYFGLDNSLGVGCYSVHCRMFSSIPDLYPLWKMSLDIAKCPLQGENHPPSAWRTTVKIIRGKIYWACYRVQLGAKDITCILLFHFHGKPALALIVVSGGSRRRTSKPQLQIYLTVCLFPREHLEEPSQRPGSGSTVNSWDTSATPWWCNDHPFIEN